MSISWFSRRWTLLTLVCFLIVALVFMPLRFALASAVPEPSVITAKSVQGTIWSGSITSLKAGQISFGDIRTELAFLPLLIGRAEFQISKAHLQDSSGITGTIGKGWGGIWINEIIGTANYQTTNAMLPVSSIEFQNFSARFTGGSCRTASGSVRLTMKVDAIPGINVGSGFLGNAKCRSGKLFLPLVSGSAMERVDITIDAKGEYALSLTLNNVEPNSAAMLSLAGFRPISGGYTRNFNDRF